MSGLKNFAFSRSGRRGSSEARQRPDARRRHESARPGAPARAARRRRRWRCRRARGSVCRSWRTVAMQKARRDATRNGEKTGHPTLASLEHRREAHSNGSASASSTVSLAPENFPSLTHSTSNDGRCHDDGRPADDLRADANAASAGKADDQGGGARGEKGERRGTC